MGEAKRRKKLNPNYGKPTSQNDPIGIEENYECYGERAEYFRDSDFYLNQGGAFEESLPRYHRYRSVTESQLFQFIQNAIDNEEQTATYILNKVKSLSDLTEIQSDLLGLVDKSIMSKRSGDLNQAFKYYDQVFSHNQTWYMLWYGLAKLLCLFREYRMAFACIKICTYLYPKMSDGRQYHSDPDLSYHYDQIYSLAIAGDETESYLKTLGRPLNTVRIADSNGKVRANSPVGKVKVVKPESLSSDIKTQVKGDSHNMNALAYYNQGAVRDDLGDKQGALADYNKAIELQPDLADAYINRGAVRSELGDTKGAIADFNKAIELQPDLAQAYNNRGAVRSELGDKKGAIADYNKAIELQPDYADAYINRGKVRDDLGDKKGAIADYNKAIELQPDYALAYGNRGIVRSELGDKQGALEDLQKAAQLFKAQGKMAYYEKAMELILYIRHLQ
ncbi:MAG: hypothetical protein RLZZ338_4774 [Cyanobacteriota bacterium]